MKYLVLDIGGTAIKYAWMNEHLEISGRGSMPTPQTSREELLDAIEELYCLDKQIDGLAISMPGIIRSECGVVEMGGALRYNNGFAIRDALSERCPVRIHIENDAKCAAMAEAGFGSLKDVSDGIALIFGTMIGGGIIHDRRLYRGVHAAAGEVSYLTVTREGMPTKENVWGNRCGVPRLCSEYAKLIGAEAVDGKVFFEAANAGEETALRVLKDYAHEVALKIFDLQTVLDPEKIAIGGGISAQGIFIDAVRDALRVLYEACPYPIPQAKVVPCTFRNDANLFGALSCLLAE